MGSLHTDCWFWEPEADCSKLATCSARLVHHDCARSFQIKRHGGALEHSVPRCKLRLGLSVSFVCYASIKASQQSDYCHMSMVLFCTVRRALGAWLGGFLVDPSSAAVLAFITGISRPSYEQSHLNILVHLASLNPIMVSEAKGRQGIDKSAQAARNNQQWLICKAESEHLLTATGNINGCHSQGESDQFPRS